MISDPKWITEARKHIGLAEIPGPKHHPEILRWLKKLSGWWSEDETPWCGTFVAHCMQECGLPIPKFWMRAKAWSEWGIRLAVPVPGCVVVFERKGGGHVGFVVGKTNNKLLMVLGGNQGNRVSIAPFDSARVLGYFWPDGVPLPDHPMLPVLAATGPVSTNEA